MCMRFTDVCAYPEEVMVKVEKGRILTKLQISNDCTREL